MPALEDVITFDPYSFNTFFFTSSFWVLNSQQNRVQKTTKELEGIIEEVWISRFQFL